MMEVIITLSLLWTLPFLSSFLIFQDQSPVLIDPCHLNPICHAGKIQSDIGHFLIKGNPISNFINAQPVISSQVWFAAWHEILPRQLQSSVTQSSLLSGVLRFHTFQTYGTFVPSKMHPQIIYCPWELSIFESSLTIKFNYNLLVVKNLLQTLSWHLLGMCGKWLKAKSF